MYVKIPSYLAQLREDIHYVKTFITKSISLAIKANFTVRECDGLYKDDNILKKEVPTICILIVNKCFIERCQPFVYMVTSNINFVLLHQNKYLPP